MKLRATLKTIESELDYSRKTVRDLIWQLDNETITPLKADEIQHSINGVKSKLRRAIEKLDGKL